MPSLKNTTSPNSILQKIRYVKVISLKSIFSLLLVFFLGIVFSSCEPSFPAKTLTSQLTKLVKEEQSIDITCHISGKTLWVYVPLTDLVKEEELTWNEAGAEKMNKVLSCIHRVLLSTDAKLDFVVMTAADVKTYGVQLITIEYIPDLRQAILENFSRGEFFERSVKDIQVDPKVVNDLTGKTRKYFDLSLNEFIGFQVIHRAKSLFLKDKTLNKLFELKSTTQNIKFGIIKLEFEFVKKKYDAGAGLEAIKPLDYIQMITALVVKNYDAKDFQAIQITDTFSDESRKLSLEDLKKTKIKLPEFLD